MNVGKIAMLDAGNGYALIAPDDGTPMVLAHVDEFGGEENVHPGTPVKFSSVQGTQGPKAYNVTILPDPTMRDRSWTPADQFSEHSSASPTRPAASFAMLTRESYEEEVMDALIAKIPGITASQVLQICMDLGSRAAHRGWLETESSQHETGVAHQ
jgi:cold shock CspA family protein